MTKEERKEYNRAQYQAHKQEILAKKKEYYKASKEQIKAYYQSNKKKIIARIKAYNQGRKEQIKVYKKAWDASNKDKHKAYQQSDVNSLGQTKESIRKKSRQILKKMNLNIPGYEIHHCFTYDDPNKFIYISKSLHLKIHQYLRDNNIDAGKDHWMDIRDLVNSTDEFMYIKC